MDDNIGVQMNEGFGLEEGIEVDDDQELELLRDEHAEDA